jgi:diguanylate cyclase
MKSAVVKDAGPWLVAGDRATRWVRWGLAIGGLLALVRLVSYPLIARPGNGYLTFWDGWLGSVTNLGPVLAIVASVARRRDNRVGWAILAVGAASNFVASFVFDLHDRAISSRGTTRPGEIVFLSSYVAFAVGLAMLIRPTDKRLKTLWLDGAIVGVGAASATVASFFAPMLSISGSPVHVAVGLSYPLFDLGIIVIVLAGLATHRYRPPWSAGLLLGGMSIFALGDIAHLSRLATSSYRPGTVLDAGWLVGGSLVGLAAWAPVAQRRRAGQRNSYARYAMPPVFAILALAVLLAAAYRPMPKLAPFLAAATMVLAASRALLTIREIRRSGDDHRLARTDELTALDNRRRFLEQLDASVQPGSTPFVLLIVDLDGFKEVNDTFGHHAGDELLVHVARRFGKALPADSALARLGGDEFGARVPLGHDLEAVPKALLSALADPFVLDGVPIRVGASIGIAAFPTDGSSRGELLRHADVAMYHAKRNNLGVARYMPDIDPNSRERLSLLDDFRTAIAGRAFLLHYQPQLNLSTGVITGVEALVRWPHASRGLLYPDVFIPMAEHSGLVTKLTRIVVDLGVAEASAYRNASGRLLDLSVNVSALDLVDIGLAEYISALCAVHNYPPPSLTLEVTETALISDPARAAETIGDLRRAGFQISVDDFGVGYSSMHQLLELAVDELKIDRSFVAGIEDDQRSRAIVKATIDLAAALNLHVVAEGVETLGTLEILREAGCDSAQGYYISRPQPLAALAEILEPVAQH